MGEPADNTIDALDGVQERPVSPSESSKHPASSISIESNKMQSCPELTCELDGVFRHPASLSESGGVQKRSISTSESSATLPHPASPIDNQVFDVSHAMVEHEAPGIVSSHEMETGLPSKTQGAYTIQQDLDARVAAAAARAKAIREARTKRNLNPQPVRAINEDDDGYDPYSDFHDRNAGDPFFERNPWS